MWSRADQRSACKRDGSSDEKRTEDHAIHRRIPAAHFSSAYIAGRLEFTLLYFPPHLKTAQDRIQAQGRLRWPLSSHPPPLTRRPPPLLFRFSRMPLNANFHTTFGAAFIGITISSLYESSYLSVTGHRRLTSRAFRCSIFGILSMQCYTYYHRYPLDRPFYKILVRTIRSPGGNGFSHTGSSSVPLGGSIVVCTEQSLNPPRDSPSSPGCWKPLILS